MFIHSRSLGVLLAVLLILPLHAFAQSDTNPPVLTGLKILTPVITQSGASQSVAIQFTVTDDLSGVSGILCSFSNPSQTKTADCSPAATQLVMGTNRNGTYQTVVNFSPFPDLGDWSVSLLWIVDNAQNIRQLTAVDLARMGIPTKITVSAAAPPPSPPQPAVPTTNLPRIGSFAQIATGGGWKTTLTLLNPSPTSVSAHIAFYSNNGQPLILQGTTSGVIDLSIVGNASFTFETELSGSAATIGWADVAASAQLSGYGIFRFRSAGNPDQEGTVALDVGGSSTGRLLIPFDNTNGLQTGIALANPSASPLPGYPNSVSMVATDETGKFLGQTFVVTLPAFGHSAFFPATLPRYDGDHGDFSAVAGKRGFIEITPANLTAIGLRFNPSGSFTSIPLMRPQN